MHDIDPDIITESDATAFVSLEYTGRGTRTVFDRRPNDWIDIDAFLFDARFDNGAVIEVQVNPEFEDRPAAEEQARRYATDIGRLPAGLRAEVRTVWIHKGGPEHLLGGGNDNILIHTGEAENLSRRGTLEEGLLHEAAHTSLDPFHKDDARWLEAQQADGGFISNYARDHPDREDIAESVVPWIAVRHRSHCIPRQVADTIIRTIPNRIAFFDSLDLDMHPVAVDQRVHLFLGASEDSGREGFLRVVNHSAQAGEVRIRAVDDAGTEAAPAILSVGASQAIHLNSRDLEGGNANKGLAQGIGSGQGEWRLTLSSELDIEALSYVRTADGFVTTMHDTAPRTDDGSLRVAFFNPGSNDRQASHLLLVNRGAADAGATIEGIDESGQSPGTAVRVRVSAGRAVSLGSEELEEGGDGFEGAWATARASGGFGWPPTSRCWW